ncbi:MAG: hypothetical protein GY874_12830 [Desulfobacteraceae bacterium]|nr:hypothetical protein [Desulfobacteraceae bacterium]
MIIEKSIKELDELAYGSSEAERISHLAKVILKHGQRLKILQDACNDTYDIYSKPGRNGKASRISGNYRKEINQCFDNMIGETDTMLKLTSQKTSMIFADNQIRKQQEGLEKMQRAADIAAGNKPVADTHLSKLEGVNVKFKEKAKGSKNLVTPTKRPARKKRSSTEISPSPECYPYIEKGKTHTSFYLSEKKTILFTESDTQVPPRSIFLKRSCIPPEQ